MASVSNQYDPNDPNSQNQAGGGSQVLNTTGAGGPPGASGGFTSAGGGSGTPQRTTPAGPPNINQYLQANQGAGAQLSQGIQSNFQNQANQVNQSVNTANNQLNQSYQPLNQNLSQGTQTIQTAFQNPQALLDAYNASKTQASNQPLSSDQQTALSQYNQFQQLNSGGYNPAIQSYGTQAQQVGNQLQNQSSALGQQAAGAANEMGRFQLLQNTVGQPNYSTGQQTLDDLFLQGQGNQLQQSLGNIANQTNRNVQGLTTDANAKLNALQGLSAQDQQQIQNTFGSGLANISTNVNNEYNNLATSAPQQQAQLQQDILSNKLTPQELQQLGVNSGTQTWGLTGQDILNAGKFTANPLAAANNGGLAQAATPEEFARYNALNQLAGGGPGQQMQANIFGTSTAAGGYNPVSFDPTALQSAINTQKSAVTGADFQNAVKSILPSLGGPVYSGSGLQSASNPNAPGPALSLALQQGLANGSLTPAQANQMISNYINGPLAANPTFGKSDAAALQPWQQYYNSEYSPDAASVLGAPSPDSTPLPANWASTVQAPGGK